MLSLWRSQCRYLCVMMFLTAWGCDSPRVKCGPGLEEDQPVRSAESSCERDSASTLDSSQAGNQPLPPEPPAIGLAVRDTAGAWCAAFRRDGARQPRLGEPVSIVFGDSGAIASFMAAITRQRSMQCHSEFAQPRWDDYEMYDVERAGGNPEGEMSSVALAVAGTAAWSRGADGITRADVDGDGRPEELRRCAADEGEHFTLWAVRNGAPMRVWHEYYDWGAFVDRTCQGGEDGT